MTTVFIHIVGLGLLAALGATISGPYRIVLVPLWIGLEVGYYLLLRRFAGEADLDDPTRPYP